MHRLNAEPHGIGHISIQISCWISERGLTNICAFVYTHTGDLVPFLIKQSSCYCHYVKSCQTVAAGQRKPWIWPQQSLFKGKGLVTGGRWCSWCLSQILRPVMPHLWSKCRSCWLWTQIYTFNEYKSDTFLFLQCFESAIHLLSGHR